MKEFQHSLLLSIKRNDLIIFIFCLIIATTFWVFKALNKTYTSQISYPIQFVFDNNKFACVKKNQSNIKINVSSYGWTLVRKGFLSKLSPILVPIKKIPQGNFILANQLDSLLESYLDGIKIISIENDTIHTPLEMITEKTIPVKVDSLAISLNQDFKITSKINIEPSSIVFQGPTSALSKIDDTLYLSLQSKNIDQSIDETINIHQKNPLLKLSHSEIKVFFEVKKRKDD